MEVIYKKCICICSKIVEIRAYYSVITKKTYTYYSTADTDKFN